MDLQAKTIGELSPEVRALFDGSNYIHVATVREDGGPHNYPAWAIIEGDEIVLATGAETDKAINLTRDPRMSVSITDRANPNKMLHLLCHVTKVLDADHGAIEVSHRIARVYTGRDHPAPVPPRLAFVFGVDDVLYLELSAAYDLRPIRSI